MATGHSIICYVCRDFAASENFVRVSWLPGPGIQVLGAYVQGRVADAEGRDSEAAVIFKELIDRYGTEGLTAPEYVHIYRDIQRRRAFTLISAGDYANAIPVLEEVRRFPMTAEDRSDALCHLASAYLQQKEYKRAKETLLLASELGIARKWQGLFQYYLGTCLLAEKDFPAALDMFYQAKHIFVEAVDLAALDNWIKFTKERMAVQ